jgi:YHS domain-containing protein
MIRFFIVRILFPLIAILLVRSVIVAVLKALSQAFHSEVQPQPKPAPTVQAGGELKKDPVCGTYVSPGASVTKSVKGELVHFCSAECRDKYQPV